MPRKKIIIRKTPFERVERVEDGYTVVYELTREQNEHDLDVFRSNCLMGVVPEDLPKAALVDSFRSIKAGNDATKAVQESFKGYFKTIYYFWKDDPILDFEDDGDVFNYDGGYECYLADQTMELVQMIQVTVDAFAQIPSSFDVVELRENALDLCKRVKGLWLKDVLIWFASTLSQIEVRDRRAFFKIDPVTILIDDCFNTPVLYASKELKQKGNNERS